MVKKPEIGKIFPCNECGQEKTIRAATFHEEKGWVNFCSRCLNSIFSKQLGESREIFFKPEEFCEKHNRPKKLWKQGKSRKLEAYCFICDQKEWESSLEHLCTDPLKLAKFFYKKGADTWPVIQRLIYFAYIRGIEQKKMLFEEKFEIWENNNPMLNSLYKKSTKGIYPLSPTTVLKNVEEPTEPFIKSILADVHQKFDYHEKEKRSLDLVWNELLKLTKEAEQELEKDFVYLEKITQRPRGYHVKEALIRYIEDMEGIKESEKYIKKKFKGKTPHDYHITEALIRYIEDMEDIRDVEKYMKKKKEGRVKYYTTEELSKRLGLDE